MRPARRQSATSSSQRLQGLGDEKHYLHDVIATADKRKPTVNGYGPVYRFGPSTAPTTCRCWIR